MRRINEAIVRERYPLPVLEDILPKFRNCKFFSTIDLAYAYHQVELDEKSREITIFVTE